MNVKQRTYSAGHFVLELDQQKGVGFCRSVEGGGVRTDIIGYQSGPTAAHLRQLGKPKYEDIKIQVGMSMSESFFAWIESFFEGEGVRKNGAIVAADFNYRERARRTLQDVLISEVMLPKLSGEDSEACFMTVTLVAEQIRFEQGSCSAIRTTVEGGDRQKRWSPNNFRFVIDGFAPACRRVTMVDSFTVKQPILEHPVGDRRDSIRVPGMLEFPNLTFRVPEADAEPFIAHFTKHVIKGVPQGDTRLSGSVVYLDHEGGELCHIDLYGVDIANVAPEKSDAGSGAIKEVRVEISCERMRFRHTNTR